jgi:hypothetical protein
MSGYKGGRRFIEKELKRVKRGQKGIKRAKRSITPLGTV